LSNEVFFPRVGAQAEPGARVFFHVVPQTPPPGNLTLLKRPEGRGWAPHGCDPFVTKAPRGLAGRYNRGIHCRREAATRENLQMGTFRRAQKKNFFVVLRAAPPMHCVFNPARGFGRASYYNPSGGPKKVKPTGEKKKNGQCNVSWSLRLSSLPAMVNDEVFFFKNGRFWPGLFSLSFGANLFDRKDKRCQRRALLGGRTDIKSIPNIIPFFFFCHVCFLRSPKMVKMTRCWVGPPPGDYITGWVDTSINAIFGVNPATNNLPGRAESPDMHFTWVEKI